MTQAASIQETPTLFERNLAAFKEHAPHLYGRLASTESFVSALVVDAGGKVDIGFQGKGFFDGDAEAFAERQVEAYLANPERQPIGQPNPEVLEGACGDMCLALTKRMAEEGIAFDPANLPRESHVLVVFGIGLGLHVAPVMEFCQARIVLLIEPNLEFLHHSLHVTEWHVLFEQAEERGAKLCFVVEQSSDAIASEGRNLLRTHNPVLLDGIYFYRHYRSAVLDQAKERVRHELFLSLSGLGFFEDELVMTDNATANLCRGDVEILSEFQPSRPEPVFIVGSGPSVEGDLDFIGANRDKAVVISLGTAIRVLMKRGIRPDFHVELENGEGTLETLGHSTKELDLAGVCLIASLTVQPRIPPMFERRLLFFREKVSSTLLFAEGFGVLQPAGPTVGNTALISAVRLGFREIFLLGVDMGSKDGERFHARESVYGLGLKSENASPSRVFPGNFGGEVTGEVIFNWSRKVLETVIGTFRTVTVYNCSDGTRIAGAIPKVSRAIHLDNPPIDRAAFGRSLGKAVRRFDLERLKTIWSAAGLPAQMERAFARIDEIMAAAAADPEPSMDWLHEVFDFVSPEGGNGLVADTYLSGTLCLCIGSLNWYDRRIASPDCRYRYRRLAIEVFRDLLADLKQRLEAFHDEIDARIAAA